ncbi:MAG TPA: tetratricopeptide repeat protein [Paraburkholderia sp.]|jgi:tetratricopeptide (TPR) repeat protein|nr:tetratricopeptide repeat protein [Paraburkholderia sp.]
MAHHTDLQGVRASPLPSAYVDSLIDTALEAHQAGRLDAAEPFYREALALDPKHVAALHFCGVLQHQRGHHAAAAELIGEALELDPTNAASWSNRGLVAAALGQYENAAICYERALQLQPAFANARNNFGVALQAQGELPAAIEQYRLALAADPALADAHLNLGTALAKQARFDDALACFRSALSLDPRSAEAHFNAGNALNAQGHHAEAIASFERALALRPHYAEAHVNLGSLIGRLGDYAGAEAHYRRAVALKPNPPNLVCLGGSLGAQGRLDEEEGFYRHALALDPDYADAHQNLAWLLLKRGDFARGWDAYARRWRKHDYASVAVAGVAEWRGEPLEGRRLLIVGEQGFGDHFQFLRYARVLQQRGATVDVRVREPLVSLVERIPGVHRAYSGDPDAPYDFWVPMMSVPACLKTDMSTIPTALPYLFADKSKIKSWRKRVDKSGKTQRKIGLAWAGSATFGNDRYRSMALADLHALGAIGNVAWYPLQKGPARDQLADAPDVFRRYDFTGDLHDFDDTAALIMNLDGVVTVDTGVAHLAAALGKPVWLMLPANSDWRWLESRGDSPWYPGMKLFRQAELGDWGPVVASVGEALRGEDG